ncbi:MAG: putative DNA-binding domain-containing protein [Rhodocyclaceae bacterium]|nr:putative DNA-binding domain-containing protein [Rhodocyclaceae bacterium]
MPETLARLQQRFGAALLDAAAPSDRLFRGPDAHTAACVALYRGNLAANWAKALGNAYPVLRALVGEDFFAALARRFGRDYAHVEGDLNTLGAGLPDFVATFGPLADHPYMADVARLEWSVHRAHSAADAHALDAATLAVIAAEDLDGLTLRLHPAVALHESPWAIDAIWLAHQPAAPVPLPAEPRQDSRALVCRPRWRVAVRSLRAGEHAALAAIAAAHPLGEALEAAITTDPDFDPADALPRWLADGLFIAPDTPTGEPT